MKFLDIYEGLNMVRSFEESCTILTKGTVLFLYLIGEENYEIVITIEMIGPRFTRLGGADIF